MSTTDCTSRYAVDPVAAARFGTSELRANFLIPDLFVEGRVKLTYCHDDRMIIGGATPVAGALMLEPVKQTGTPRFLDRRELIAVNIGGPGVVEVNGEASKLGHRDMIYVGMGVADVRFSSEDAKKPAKFYLISAPAYQSHPTRVIGIDAAKRLDLGSRETANERSIFQFIHPEGAKTCQLVVGMTTLAPGSIWNTMPAHVHDRRSEAYLYFGLPDEARVFHFMGQPTETRHLVVANEQAVVSPCWSIHSGAGTSNYNFIWAMAGDNVDYTDVDPIKIGELV
ncbi:MAG TPA: 5-dehydro-4-deoxy-D-glucuronate isomerase [Mesorhizobium sp.]|nr:5-dehydro-4-deoxy-D-glucuronate isomerase [Mesorhizobium sp.]